MQYNRLWVFAHESKNALVILSNCFQVTVIIFGPCVGKFASWTLIWIAQFKWWSGGIFQWVTTCTCIVVPLKSRSEFGVWMHWPLNCDLGDGATWLNVTLRLFSHDGKVRILNRDSRCASWIMIRNTVFWTVCTPNHVKIRDLRCASQITVQRCFRVMHLKSRISTWFGVHTVQNTVFRIVIQDAHLESRFKIRTLPSCENSLRLTFSNKKIYLNELSISMSKKGAKLLLPALEC